MKTRLQRLLPAAFLLGASAIFAAPIAAHADDSEQYRRCLAKSANDANQEQARSECMWRHWDCMASYGR